MPPPPRHDDALRARLVELASQIVAEAGSRGLSLRTVAADAGTTTAAIYTLFGGRDGLVRAVVEEGFRRFARRLDGVERTDDPAADLFALGIAYRENARENPHYYRVMFGPVEGQHDGSEDGTGVPVIARPTFGVLHAAVMRIQPQEAEEQALRLWSLVHGLVSLEIAGVLPGTPDERAARYAAALRASRL